MNVVLLHTAFANRRQWHPQRAALEAQGHTVHTPEMTCASIEEWAEQIVSEVSGDFVVMGASMGAYTAGQIATISADRVLGILVASIITFRAFPEDLRRQRFDEPVALHRRADTQTRWEAIRRTLYAGGRALHPGAEQLLYEMMVEVGAQQGAAHLAAVRDHPDTSAAVAALVASGIPLLAVASDRDPLMHLDDYQSLVDEVGARVEVIADCGHVPPVDQPEALARLATAFVRELDR